jgi:hypothetical protein
MARPYQPRVNDVVTYYNAVTAKPRPAKVTVKNGVTPTLKILGSGEVFAAVVRTSTGRAPGTWKSV